MDLNKVINDICEECLPVQKHEPIHITNERCSLKLVLEKGLKGLSTKREGFDRNSLIRIDNIIQDIFSYLRYNSNSQIKATALYQIMRKHLKNQEDTLPIDGSLPLHPEHICFKDGHNMQRVFQIDKQHQSLGKNACSRCGYEMVWQFPKDFGN